MMLMGTTLTLDSCETITIVEARYIASFSFVQRLASQEKFRNALRRASTTQILLKPVID